MYTLISQLSDPECAVFIAGVERLSTSKGEGPMIRAMTLTVSVDDGPTVRLAYDPRHADARVPGWQRQYEIVVPCTTVNLEQQPGAAAPTWLKDLLVDAFAYLLMYAGQEQHWPAELREVAPPDAQPHPTPEA